MNIVHNGYHLSSHYTKDMLPSVDVSGRIVQLRILSALTVSLQNILLHQILSLVHAKILSLLSLGSLMVLVLVIFSENCALESCLSHTTACYHQIPLLEMRINVLAHQLMVLLWKLYAAVNTAVFQVLALTVLLVRRLHLRKFQNQLRIFCPRCSFAKFDLLILGPVLHVGLEH